MADTSNYSWVAIMGRFTAEQDGHIRFLGEPLKDVSGQVLEDAMGAYSTIGTFVSDERLTDGEIEAVVEFSQVGPREACEIVLYFDPSSNSMVTAGLGTVGAFNVRYSFGQEWTTLFASGDRRNLEPGVPYRIKVRRIASTITMSVDGVVVARTTLPARYPSSQVGLWCLSSSEIRISGFRVESKKPQAFVVMQFSPFYDALYKDVIQPVCKDFGVNALRADSKPGPGFIIQDIVREIEESTFVIAEITEPNPNVFWEVGYAHALFRPTVLLAVRGTELPFDVSGFRVLLYENSVAGTKGIGDGLRDSIDAIMKSTTDGP